MARPGVAAKKIATKAAGVAKIRRAIGQTRYVGIDVLHHCIGIVARTWRLPPQSANYDTAYEAAQAVIKAGKMRHGRPSIGSLAWWSTGSGHRPGHVATVVGVRRNHVICNVGNKIARVPMSYFDSFDYLGFCMPGDVPSWV